MADLDEEINAIKERLTAAENVIFSDDTDISQAVIGLFSMLQHLAFLIGDTFHDSAETFANGMDHIGKLLEQTETATSDPDDEGPNLTVIDGGSDED